MLQYHGKLNFSDIEKLTAEERSWWIKRLNQEHEKQQEAQKKQSANIPKPRKPSVRKR